MNIQDLLHRELKGSFDFFYQCTNLEPGSNGFGLTMDCTRKVEVASIASVGFALTAWVIAAERGFLDRAEALAITRGTLHTLLDHARQHRGFFAHFLRMEKGAKHRNCEFSTIDTSLCLNGVITADAYFRDAEIAELTAQLLERVDWNFLVFEHDGQTLFKMAYIEDCEGSKTDEKAGLVGQWDMAAEQKMMYLQAAARLEPMLAKKLYAGFSRDTGLYEGQEVIINPDGNLFAYLFSEAWLDTASYLDPDGIDWFNNTRLAALADQQFCIDHAGEYKTYHKNSWGLSAGDSPSGYDVFGSTPSLRPPKHNGTVSIYSALACLPFTPDQTLGMIQYLYENHPKSWGPYGFYDSYNLDVRPAWYSQTLYGIDKGCSMIMLENYLSGLVWNTYTNSSYIQKALSVLGFKKRTGK